MKNLTCTIATCHVLPKEILNQADLYLFFFYTTETHQHSGDDGAEVLLGFWGLLFRSMFGFWKRISAFW